jgi:outer membrane immunogenic protein
MRNAFTRRVSASFLALAAATTLATPAFAQDEDRHPFDGIYVGGSFGGALQPNDIGSSVRFDRDRNGSFGDTVVTALGDNAFSPGFCNGYALSGNQADGCGNDSDGVEYYGRVGADGHVGAMVIGVMGEFGRPEISDSVSAFSTTPASYTLTRKLDYTASIRGRIGFTPAPMRTTLFYATGGATYGKIKNSFTTTNTANSFTASGNQDVWGFSGGGGVEQKIGRNFSLGLEYIYTELNDDKARVNVGAGTAAATNPFLLAGAGGTDFRRSDDKFRWHSLRITAAVRF